MLEVICWGAKCNFVVQESSFGERSGILEARKS